MNDKKEAKDTKATGATQAAKPAPKPVPPEQIGEAIATVLSMKTELQNELGVAIQKFTDKTHFNVSAVGVKAILKGGQAHAAGYMVEVKISV
jgi:hypothetical protein